jgi:hypothetical protein
MRDINFVIKTVAKQKELPEDTVKKVYNLYWKVVKEKVDSGLYTAIDIKNVGSFAPNYWWICKKIREIIKSIRNPKSTEKGIERKKEILKKLIKIKNLTSPYYYDRYKRLIKKGVGKQGTHSTGNND